MGHVPRNAVVPTGAPSRDQHALADRATTVAARATELSKVYGQGETQVVALDRVSVDFRQAEFTAIMGPRGPASPR